jgi:hypothetical protein
MLSGMKKVVFLFAVLFFTTVILSSCNKKECPAYSKAYTEQTEQVV